MVLIISTFGYYEENWYKTALFDRADYIRYHFSNSSAFAELIICGRNFLLITDREFLNLKIKDQHNAKSKCTYLL